MNIKVCYCGNSFRVDPRHTVKKYCSVECRVSNAIRRKSEALKRKQVPPTMEQIGRSSIAVLGSLGIIWDADSRAVWLYCVANDREQYSDEERESK